ncbi:DUF4193 domain-containing protein [Arthrobacter sp. NamB2]|uniref:DUF4193 family protein n=1 Tax=Arthrobacter sp. NamB2 TaxID=2576035 RepID=UPI0010C9D935|nr:DUF4193 family protein [Arthrobacter sp. NamB2]TKV28181.1 DUF4193 domain-containing protein [Arthrobacter sp. NamB2]
MTTDYDALHTALGDGDTRTGEGRRHRAGQQGTLKVPSGTLLTKDLLDEDELAAAEAFDLPGADLSSEEVSVQILAAQADEFTCASCFLVRHRSQIALERGGQLYCSDCEG